jgi:phage terminase large subunit-like protein
MMTKKKTTQKSKPQVKKVVSKPVIETGKNGLPLHADDLRAMGEDVVDLLLQLDPKKAEELRYNWKFWARPNQLSPQGDWNTWFINAGRGFGKTRAGVEWVRQQVILGKKRGCAIAATNSDIERVMINGESGFLNCCWEGDKTVKGARLGKPNWSPTKRTLTWENGAQIQFFSAEEPERLRGPQFEFAWCDELAAWNRDRDTWDMLQFCLRLGRHPQTCVTTTPKPTKLVRDILKNQKTVVTSGSTFDNSANLAAPYLQAVKAQYEGTRLGRQELYAEIMDEASGALWNRQLLEKCEVDVPDPVEFAEKLARVVVAIDPAVTSNAESDMTGIVVAGIDISGNSFVLEDATDRYTPEQWATKAVDLYFKYSADRIVAERNQGGDMVRHTIQTVNEVIPIRLVHASRGKFARAEPVSSLYERGKVKHVRGLDELENQMVQWEPLGSIGSPDRLDALVWAITDLALQGISKPSLNLAYADAKGLIAKS